MIFTREIATGPSPWHLPTMADLTNPRVIKLKGFLFLFAGFLASGLLLFDSPTLKTASLLGIAIWSFSRFYYFAFYVIQHYVDPSFRFAGLGSFFRYWFARRSEKRTTNGH